MTLYGDRWRRPSSHGTIALLLATNLLVLLAYVAGLVEFFEVILVYVLDLTLACGALAAKLLFVEPPADDQPSRTLVTVERTWLPSPLVITWWNVRTAVGAFVGYLVGAALFWGFSLAVVWESLSAQGADVVPMALSPSRVAVLLAGYGLVHLVAFGRFLLNGQFGPQRRDTVEDQFGVAGTRSIVAGAFFMVTFLLSGLPVAPELLVLLGFVAIKSVLEIKLGPDVVEAMEEA